MPSTQAQANTHGAPLPLPLSPQLVSRVLFLAVVDATAGARSGAAADEEIKSAPSPNIASRRIFTNHVARPIYNTNTVTARSNSSTTHVLKSAKEMLLPSDASSDLSLVIMPILASTLKLFDNHQCLDHQPNTASIVKSRILGPLQSGLNSMGQTSKPTLQHASHEKCNHRSIASGKQAPGFCSQLKLGKVGDNDILLLRLDWVRAFCNKPSPSAKAATLVAVWTVFVAR